MNYIIKWVIVTIVSSVCGWTPEVQDEFHKVIIPQQPILCYDTSIVSMNKSFIHRDSAMAFWDKAKEQHIQDSLKTTSLPWPQQFIDSIKIDSTHS